MRTSKEFDELVSLQRIAAITNPVVFAMLQVCIFDDENEKVIFADVEDDKFDRESVFDLILEWAENLPEWITAKDLDNLVNDLNEFISH